MPAAPQSILIHGATFKEFKWPSMSVIWVRCTIYRVTSMSAS